MPSKYTFSEYNDQWPLMFEHEATALQRLLTDQLIAIHHIGSTSVPGLASKPIIDLLPEVIDLDTIDCMGQGFIALGYQVWGEYGLPGRRYFTKDDPQGYRTHNVHLYQTGNPEIIRHLAFRAYLRANQSVRIEYEALKRQAFLKFPNDIGAYNNYKNSWIKQIERKAIDWFATVIQPLAA